MALTKDQVTQVLKEIGSRGLQRTEGPLKRLFKNYFPVGLYFISLIPLPTNTKYLAHEGTHFAFLLLALEGTELYILFFLELYHSILKMLVLINLIPAESEILKMLCICGER